MAFAISTQPRHASVRLMLMDSVHECWQRAESGRCKKNRIIPMEWWKQTCFIWKGTCESELDRQNNVPIHFCGYSLRTHTHNQSTPVPALSPICWWIENAFREHRARNHDFIILIPLQNQLVFVSNNMYFCIMCSADDCEASHSHNNAAPHSLLWPMNE